MQTIVIDTNVVVSAVLSETGNPAKILNINDNKLYSYNRQYEALSK